jgi:hypothetical protein
VVVVVGYDEQQVLINDPVTAHAPVAVVWDEFLMVWAEFDEVAMMIHRISPSK